MLSGKKIIYEDSKEIVCVTSLLTTEFNHTWNSENSSHIFRIEANFGIASEHTYVFLIDGVRFIDMPRKPLSGTSYGKYKDSSYADDDSGHNDSFVNKSRVHKSNDSSLESYSSPQYSSNFEHSKSNQRGSFQSPSMSKVSSSDPFAVSPDDLFSSSNPSNIPSKQAEGNLIDDYFNEPQPNVGFDSFFGNSNSNQLNTVKTDKSTNNAFDSSFSSSNNDFDPFSPPTRSFDSSSSSDPFAPSTFVSNTSNNKFTAKDIMSDFAGLTLTTPSQPIEPAPVVAPVSIINVGHTAVEIPLSSDTSNKSQDADAWGTKLVNLDLTQHGELRPTKSSSQPIKTTLQQQSLQTSASNPFISPVKPPMNPPPAYMGPHMNSGSNALVPSNGMYPVYNTVPMNSAVTMNSSFDITPNGPSNPPFIGLPAAPLGYQGRPTMGMNYNNGVGSSVASGVPVNPFSSPVNNSKPISTRPISQVSTAPLDPFQNLTSLANPNFKSSNTMTSNVSVPLSSGISTRSSHPQVKSQSSLDSIEWRTS